MPMPQEQNHTIEDIYALPDGRRAELIDGQIYDMAPPNTTHQRILYAIARRISDYIDKAEGNCEVFLAPFAIFLNEDDRNYVEPDISVICDGNKLDDKGCHGAPDWISEVTSPSTARIDYGIKLFKYHSTGVREYWIVNPLSHTTTVYDFKNEQGTNQYNFDDDISVCIYKDLSINIASLL